MREVTIEGTETPAAGVLARGKRATVAYTARIARLISFGYVRIVSGPTPVESEPVIDGADVAQSDPGGDDRPDPEPGDPQIETTSPPKPTRSRGPRT